MSTATVHPLHLVEPLPDQQRFAWLVYLRRQAARAFDTAVSAPRRAAAFLARAVSSLRSSALHHLPARLRLAVRALSTRLGAPGVIAGVVTGLADRHVRGIAGTALRVVGRGLAAAGRLGLGLVRRGLGLFGRRGQQAAQSLDRAAAMATKAVLARAQAARALVGGVVSRNSDAVDAVGQLARMLLVHRLLRGGNTHRLARLGLDVALAPNGLVRKAWNRLSGLLRRLTGKPDPAPVPPGGAGRYPGSWAAHERALQQEAEGPGRPDHDPAAPVPSNRAERRAQERLQARKGNARSRTS